MLMIPLTLILAGVFLYLFIKATKQGQFDDLVTPAYEILIDESEDTPENLTPQSTTMEKANGN